MIARNADQLNESNVQVVENILRMTRATGGKRNIAAAHEKICKDAASMIEFANLRTRLGVEELYLWTLYSRQKTSTLFQIGGEAHLVIDDCQLEAISAMSLIKFPGFSDNQRLWTMAYVMVQEYLNVENIEMALACLRWVSDGNQLERFGAPSSVHEEREFQERVQRLFVMAHEFAHLFIVASSLESNDNFKNEFTARIDQLLEFRREVHEAGAHMNVNDAIWIEDNFRHHWQQLTKDNDVFREELICDGIAIELVEGLLRQEGVLNEHAAIITSEAIFLCMYAIDTLRLLRQIASKEETMTEDEFKIIFLGRNMLRTFFVGGHIRDRFNVGGSEMSTLMSHLTSKPRDLPALLVAIETLKRARPRLKSTAMFPRARSSINKLSGWSERGPIYYEQLF